MGYIRGTHITSTFKLEVSLLLRFFVTPSDSVAIIAANAIGAIPYFSSGLKGVARYYTLGLFIYLFLAYFKESEFCV